MLFCRYCKSIDPTAYFNIAFSVITSVYHIYEKHIHNHIILQYTVFDVSRVGSALAAERVVCVSNVRQKER